MARGSRAGLPLTGRSSSIIGAMVCSSAAFFFFPQSIWAREAIPGGSWEARGNSEPAHHTLGSPGQQRSGCPHQLHVLMPPRRVGRMTASAAAPHSADSFSFSGNRSVLAPIDSFGSFHLKAHLEALKYSLGTHRIAVLVVPRLFAYTDPSVSAALCKDGTADTHAGTQQAHSRHTADIQLC